MGAFDEIGAIVPQRIWDGVLGRVIRGERTTLGVVELDPHSVVPEHSHDNEQVGVVLSGTLQFRIGEELRELAAGGMYVIPANMPHEVHTGPNGAVVVDVFAPVREDWESLAREERLPRWPEAV